MSDEFGHNEFDRKGFDFKLQQARSFKERESELCGLIWSVCQLYSDVSIDDVSDELKACQPVDSIMCIVVTIFSHEYFTLNSE